MTQSSSTGVAPLRSAATAQAASVGRPIFSNHSAIERRRTDDEQARVPMSSARMESELVDLARRIAAIEVFLGLAPSAGDEEASRAAIDQAERERLQQLVTAVKASVTERAAELASTPNAQRPVYPPAAPIDESIEQMAARIRRTVFGATGSALNAPAMTKDPARVVASNMGGP